MNLEPRRRSGWRKLAAWAAGTLVLIILLSWAASCAKQTQAPRGSGGVRNLPVPTTVIGSPPPLASALPPAEVLPTDVPLSAPSGVDEGTYEVGADMPAGKYKTTGPDPADPYPYCYFARLKHNDGTLKDIIQNDNLNGRGVVTVKAGEFFETKGCASWLKQAG